MFWIKITIIWIHFDKKKKMNAFLRQKFVLIILH